MLSFKFYRIVGVSVLFPLIFFDSAPLSQMLLCLLTQELPPTLLKYDKIWDFEVEKTGMTAKSHMAASTVRQSCPLLVSHLPEVKQMLSLLHSCL